MRNLIFAINISLDGCCDHTKLTGYEDIHKYFTELMHDTDLIVYGRKTYQLMVPYWPDVAKSNSGHANVINEFAHVFDSIQKVVFSQSLKSVEDKNSRLVSTNLVNEIRRLKQEQSKSILMGGVSMPSELIELGLVDEFRFIVQPIIVGEGRRLFDGISLPNKLGLELVDVKTLKSGCVALRYLKQ